MSNLRGRLRLRRGDDLVDERYEREQATDNALPILVNRVYRNFLDRLK